MGSEKADTPNTLEGEQPASAPERDFSGAAKEQFLPPISDKMHEQIHAWLKTHPSLPTRGLSYFMLEIAQSVPSIFNRLYPRQYENIGPYHSPKLVAAALSTILIDALHNPFEQVPTATTLMLPALTSLISKRMPLMFIAPELLRSVQRTDFHGDINWTSMHLPYEHGIFVLPKGAYTHPSDGDVVFILWSRLRPGEYPPPVEGLPRMQITETSMSLVALCEKTGMWYDSNLTARKRPTLQLHNLFYTAPGEQVPAIKKQSPLDADLTAGDSEFIEGLGVIAFGTLLALAARPALNTPARLIRALPANPHKSAPAREFWSPNIVGQFYHPARAAGAGTHASPRMHWRRGHLRQQPCGPGRQERKVVWIEPCLIAAGAAEEGPE